MVTVTTSWDDGHVLDLRLARLLQQYGVQGTFYVSPHDREIPKEKRLTDEQLRELSALAEVGAHTMTHPRLHTVSDTEARVEIKDAKTYLEQVIGKPVPAFCYPGGSYRARHIPMVREAGFTYARTVQRHRFGVGPQHEAVTTLHTYNHYTDLYKIARFAHWNPFRTYQYFQWDVLAKAMFDHVCEHGGVFHLWGHSWEIDMHDDWEKLEEVLQYIAHRKGAQYVVNSALVTPAVPKRALVATAYFPPHGGGVEQYSYETATRLAADDTWDVTVLTTQRGKGDVVADEAGMRVHRLGYRRMLSNSPVSFRWIYQLWHLLRTTSFDVVHVHLPVPGLGDLVALLLPHYVPLVVTYHAGSMHKGVWYLDWAVWLYEHTLLRVVLWRADHIVCSSDFVRTKFLSRYVHKSSTITPAVDSTLFTPAARQDLLRSPTIFAVGGLGRAETHKGLRALVTMLPKIRAAVPDVQLVVAGAGDMQASYEAQVYQLGLVGVVRFLGRLDRSAMAATARSADVFVLPTKNDSFPTVILEAMASGVPVVATDVGSITDMVEEGVTGYVVQPHDMDTFTGRVVELLRERNRGHAMGMIGRRRAVQHFHWEGVVARYADVYAAVTDPKPTLAHVVAYYPPHVGGMEVVARALSEEYARRGYPVVVYTSRQGTPDAPHLTRSSGLRVYRLAGFEFAHTPVMWTLPFRLFLLPKRTIIHVHLAQVLLPELALFAAWVRNYSVVAQFHLDVDPSGPLGWLFVLYKKHVLPRVLRRMDRVMVFSDDQEQVVMDTHGVSPERIAHVTNAVHQDFFQERLDPAPHTPFRVLTLSRLNVQKRVDRLIRAVGLMAEQVELTVIGEGEDRAELEALAKTVAPGRVQFVGGKTHAEIQTYHRVADVFVIPSDKEGGMPLTVLEAMAAGLPVVGGDVPGVRELVGQAGVVVDAPSPESFAAALSDLYTHPERFEKLSQQSSTCAAQYTWEHAADTVEDVYRAL